MDTRLFILNELKRVAEEIAPEPIRKRSFLQLSSATQRQVRKHFESWNAALAEAGLEPAPLGPRRQLSDDVLMGALGDLWTSRGKRPTEDAMNREGKYSVKPYRDRWGSFSKAVAYYVNHNGMPKTPSVTPSSPDSFSASKPLGRGGATMRSAPTHKPAQPRQQRLLVGEPIDFRGLRYAPVNEQGVVYLFGMVSHELGFLVETVRTKYPDCEGKRRLDAEGEHWEHIRIEFEYRSKNFLDHSHAPEQCELIVCWIHDWPDSPIEVLELRNAIKYLPSLR